MTYVAFLRGINVGGHQVKMDKLRAHFAELGFERVRSHIQSGNVFFDSAEADRAGLSAKIEVHLKQTLGYAVPTMLRTLPEFEALMALDPFRGIEIREDMRACVLFVAGEVPQNLELPLYSPKRDVQVVSVTKSEAFVIWYLNAGKPPSGNFLDKTLGSATTTRFFHTALKILEAAKS